MQLAMTQPNASMRKAFKPEAPQEHEHVLAGAASVVRLFSPACVSCERGAVIQRRSRELCAAGCTLRPISCACPCAFRGECPVQAAGRG